MLVRAIKSVKREVRQLLPAIRAMSVEKTDPLALLRKAVKEQGDVVRQMKEQGAPQLELLKAVEELKQRRKTLEQKEKEAFPIEKFDRVGLEGLIKRRFFYGPSASLYGGVAGLYDFGPMGCAMKSRLLQHWRQHFIVEESMLEVDCCVLTPAPVLRASGHVERFADLMVKDEKTGECFRADHLLEQHMEKLCADAHCSAEKRKEYDAIARQADNFSADELEQLFSKYDIRAPLTGHKLTAPQEFNLMFSTTIGPGGGVAGFLRPETAQGMFVNFKKLLEFNNGKLPFAAAQIGKAFRNEISPRSGLLRVREFEMAEIEHFVDPNKKNDFPKFSEVADEVVTFYSAGDQMEGRPAQQLTVGEAVERGLVFNKTLGYFIGRIFLFLLQVGVAKEKLRFRQHLGNEMAHYACDCWDAECKTSYGWVECVGCADRSCYDLSQHQKASGVDLSAKIELPEPYVVECMEAVPCKPAIGKKFRNNAKVIMDELAKLSSEQLEFMRQALDSRGRFELQMGAQTFFLTPEMVSVQRSDKTVHVINVTPSVIEPSFGIGRILYSVLEHNYHVREDDEQRNWLSLPSCVAPIGCSVLPLSSNPQFSPFVSTLATGLKKSGVSIKVDDSGGSIGRRYARTDEIGIPFGITVDFDTPKFGTATLRERNSTKQIRANIKELPALVSRLVHGNLTWREVLQQFPLFTGQESVG